MDIVQVVRMVIQVVLLRCAVVEQHRGLVINAVRIPISIVVAVRDIVLVAELLVVASTRVAIVPHITIGMVVRVFIRTVIPVRAGIKHRAPE